MNKAKIALIALGIIILLRGVAVATAADAPGIMKGAVVNKTAGGDSISGQQVTLVTYSGSAEKGSQTATLDAQGQFSFQGLGVTPDLAYQLQFQYKGVDYGAHPVSFPAGSTEQTAELAVFEPTADQGMVKSTARHYLLQPEPGGLMVSEIVILKNGSDRVYVGSTEVQPGLKETLRIELPAEATDVQFGQGMTKTRVVQLPGGYADTLPIFPGDGQRIFRYKIPATGDSAVLSTRLSMATDRVSALAPDNGIQLSATGLPERGSRDMQGAKSLLLSGQNLPAGTELRITVDQLSKAGTVASAAGAVAPQPSSQMTPLALVGGAAVLGVVAAGVVLVRRRRAGDGPRDDDSFDVPEQLDDAPESQALETERERLVAAIARLDDDHEQGKLGSEEYGRLRAEKKQQLLRLVARQKESARGAGR